jgi:hypothetical protein
MRPKSHRRSRREQLAAPAKAPRANLYDEITKRIIAELEAGACRGSSRGVAPAPPRPACRAMRSPPGLIRGINVLILWGAVIDHGWPSQSWLTFRQAQEAGGCVRKGEHGVTVVYADRFTPEAELERAVGDGDGGERASLRGRTTAEHGRSPSSSASPSSMSRSARGCAPAWPAIPRRCPSARSCRSPRR